MVKKGENTLTLIVTSTKKRERETKLSSRTHSFTTLEICQSNNEVHIQTIIIQLVVLPNFLMLN